MSASRNKSVIVNQNRIILKTPINNSLTTKRNAQYEKDKFLISKAGFNFLEIRNRFEIFTNEDTPSLEYENKIKPSEDATIVTKKSKKHNKRSKYQAEKSRVTESSEHFFPKIIRCKQCFVSHFPFSKICAKSKKQETKIPLCKKKALCDFLSNERVKLKEVLLNP